MMPHHSANTVSHIPEYTTTCRILASER